MAGTKFFADRIFIAANGFEVAHLTKCDITRTRNLQRKETMSRNRRTAGYTEGNLGVKISAECAIERLAAQIDFYLMSGADISIVAECGGDRYIVKGVQESEMRLSGSVGDGSKSFELEGLDIVNENGTSVNADISLR